jgi:hypothetical protein
VRRFFATAAAVLTAATAVALPASAAPAPAVLPAKVSGTWYFVDKTPACPDHTPADQWEATACGWVWVVKVSGKKVWSYWYGPQANGVYTNGPAKIQDRRINGICTNGFREWACGADRRFAASGRPMTPSGGKRVTRAKAMAAYPGLVKALPPWGGYQPYPASDPSALVPCANNLTKLAQQLRSENKSTISGRTKSTWEIDCRGDWAYIVPPEQQFPGDAIFVAHRVDGRWRLAFGLPAGPVQMAGAPAWVVERAS